MPDDRTEGPVPGPELLNPGGLAIEEGVVEDIVYRSEESGYTVAELAVSDDKAMIAVGIMPFLARGETVRMQGTWTRHPEYGDQFKVSRYEAVAPGTESAIVLYLSSGIVRGVGEKLAARIVKQFGEDTLRVMREQPERLAGVKGISPDAAKRIAAELREKQEYQELALLLSPFGIGMEKILRIHRQYGMGAVELVRDNPFRLADEVYGIGFHTADRIARSLDCAPDSPYRMRSAVRYTLSQGAAAGHTSLPEDVLLEQASRLVGLRIQPDNPDYIRMQVSGQTVTGDPDGTGTRVALRSLHDAEKNLAERLAALASCDPPDRIEDLEARVDRLAEQADVELAAEQRDAVLLAARSGACVVTGGPGTGKTTLIHLLCRLFGQVGKRIQLTAPTGQAAKRLTQAAGIEARTIHRLLETRFMGEEEEDRLAGPRFRRNADNPLDADVLVVDEVSMADVLLLDSLLAAMRPGARIVLVGDADQLPPVGPGNALRDILASDCVPAVRLTRIYRQSEAGRIVENAHRINRGEYPVFQQSDDSDFMYVPRKTPEDMAAAAVKLCSEVLPGRYGYDPFQDIQVIAPSRKGPAGIPVLNRALQAVLNPRAGEKERGFSSRGFRFCAGDRVMQISNDYSLEWREAGNPLIQGTGIFNGETGIIRSVDEEEGTLEVLFDEDRLVVYDRSMLDELDPAYAVTVHKSQGSEYPVVVLVLPPGPPMLLTRNLLYTAVSRARERLFLLSNGEVLARTIANNQRSERHTALEPYLRQARVFCEQSLPGFGV